uniref:WGS project CBMI000000000 data, contig CS3069_c002980 n=1 Tax=Fusarium clavum TaxID=2594811 RepID=A0A090MJB8_9HYPO|nr:unnamed protein product [Fusarium clavum]
MNNNNRDDSPHTIGRGEMSTELSDETAIANIPSVLGREANSFIRYEEDMHKDEIRIMVPYAKFMNSSNHGGRLDVPFTMAAWKSFWTAVFQNWNTAYEEMEPVPLAP